MITGLPDIPDWDAPAIYRAERDYLLFRDTPFGGVVAAARGALAYLATPYSRIAVNDAGDWDIGLSIEASVRAIRWAGQLAEEGVTAVSPIIQAAEMVHVLSPDRLDPLDHHFWTRWCAPLLQACPVMIVPPIPGWNTSLGVWHEVCAHLATIRRVYLIRGDAEYRPSPKAANEGSP